MAKTDFDKHAVPFEQIMSGGVGKDRIPSIDQSRFVVVAQEDGLAATEPVVGLTVNGKSWAIPYRS